MKSVRTRRFWGVIFPALLVGRAVCVGDATAAASSWTLEECLHYAREHSPRLARAREDLRSAAGSFWTSAGTFLPHASFGGTYTENNTTPLGDLAAAMPFGLPPSITSPKYYDLTLSASQTVFSWAMKPTFSSGRAAVGRARALESKERNDLVLDVKKAFFGALYARQTLQISQTAEAVAKESYDTSEALYQEGKASHFDVSRAKVAWVNAQTATIAAESGLRIAREELKTVLGLSEGAVEPAGEFQEAAFVPRDMEQEVNLAWKGRPELEELRLMGVMADAGVELARSGLLPFAGLNYRRNWESLAIVSNRDAYYRTWTVGAFVSLPILDGGSSWGRLRSAKADRSALRATEREAKDGVALEVRQACLLLKDAAERLPAQRENVDTAKENMRIARRRYALGLLSQLELKDAELSLTEAETQYVKALFDYHTARAALDHSTGSGEGVN